MFTVNVIVHVYTADEAARIRVTALEEAVSRLMAQERAQMSINDDVDTRMTQMDAATTEVANDLQDLRDQIASGETLTEAQKAALLAKLDSRIARLVQLGQDPSNPVPQA